MSDSACISSSLKIEVLSLPDEKNPFLILYKPSGLPSAPLAQGQDSALTQAIAMFPQLEQVVSNKIIEHGLLHRIDTATSGILVIASTQQAFDFLFEEQKAGRFIKKYFARCDSIQPDLLNERQDYPPFENKVIAGREFSVQSYFRPFGKGRSEVRPVTKNSNAASLKKAGAELYTTNIVIEKKSSGFEANCSLTKGFRHQVRSHLAWCGFPVKGDRLYNTNSSNNCDLNEMQFFAVEVSFLHPLTHEKVAFTLPEKYYK